MLHVSHVRRYFADQTLGTDWRALRLAWSEAQRECFGPALLPQRAFITEGVCEPTEARIDCLALSSRLRTLTGIVVALDPMHLHTDDLGRSKVRPLGAETGADTTAWVRHRTPCASSKASPRARFTAPSSAAQPTTARSRPTTWPSARARP